jgi:type II secretory pathway component PulF
LPTFAYKAIDASGQMFSGTTEAPKLSALLGQLEEKSLTAVSVVEARREAARSGRRFFSGRVSKTQLANFSEHLGSMLAAGLPLIEALETLAQSQDSPALARIAAELAAAVRDGRSLSDALADHAHVFGDLYVSMVRAGEESGNLAEILRRNAEFIEKEAELAAKVRDALTYPAIVAAVATVVVAGMLIFIIPKFVKLLENVGAETPWPTRVLMILSSTLVTRWYVIVAVVAAAAFGARAALVRPAVRLWIDRHKLRAPVVGPLFLRVSIARFSRTLATLLASGLPILQSLELVRRVLGNVYLDRVVAGIAEEIRDGETITAPLRRARVFPPMVLQMIHVGESSGSLERMLVRIGEIYEKEVDRATKRLSVVMEPLMMVGIGVFVSFVALALLLPMVKAIGTMGKS